MSSPGVAVKQILNHLHPTIYNGLSASTVREASVKILGFNLNRMQEIEMIQKIKPLAIFIFVLLLWFSWQSFTPAQSTNQLESRLSRIELENTMLRSRISQLESQAARLNANAGVDSSPPVTDRPTSAVSPLADDPTFKRLATLVIELKERVVAVENQVTAIAPVRSSSQ